MQLQINNPQPFTKSDAVKAITETLPGSAEQIEILDSRGYVCNLAMCIGHTKLEPPRRGKYELTLLIVA